jgi:hypothetical protein
MGGAIIYPAHMIPGIIIYRLIYSSPRVIIVLYFKIIFSRLIYVALALL